MKNLKIKYKLIIMLLPPLLGLSYFAGQDIYKKSIFTSNITEIQSLTEFSVKASALVHELQKERGASAGFLGSKGKKFISELPQQRSSTDKLLIAYQEFSKTFNTKGHGNSFYKFISQANDSLSRLNQIRSSISDLSIPPVKAIGYFTTMNGQFLNAISEITKLSSDPEITVLFITYVNFLKGKEKAGIERAVMSNVFGAANFLVLPFRDTAS